MEEIQGEKPRKQVPDGWGEKERGSVREKRNNNRFLGGEKKAREPHLNS